MLLAGSPVRVYVEANCVQSYFHEVKTFGRHCLLVTGKNSARRSGALSEVCHSMLEQDIIYSEWDSITPNPTVEECSTAGDFARKNGADMILGIGGGSAMDAAKAIAVFAANPELDEASFYAKDWKREPLPIVLVGTTAGTGSEVTKVSVLTDSTGRKHSIKDDKLLPVIAFGDARYTESMPREVRLSTGLDTLMHCLESYFNKLATEASQKESIIGISMAAPLLMRFVKGESLNLEQQERLYEASLHGGLSIYTASTCFPHKLGYWLTETFGIPHGFACAEFMDRLLAHAREAVPESCHRLEEETGVPFEMLNDLCRRALPQHNHRVFPQEMEKILPRWENDSSLLNTVGVVTMRDVERFMSRYEWND